MQVIDNNVAHDVLYWTCAERFFALIGISIPIERYRKLFKILEYTSLLLYASPCVKGATRHVSCEMRRECEVDLSPVSMCEIIVRNLKYGNKVHSVCTLFLMDRRPNWQDFIGKDLTQRYERFDQDSLGDERCVLLLFFSASNLTFHVSIVLMTALCDVVAQKLKFVAYYGNGNATS